VTIDDVAAAPGTVQRVGIDVGGTKCLGVRLSDDGTIADEFRVPTPHEPDALIATLADIAERLGADSVIGVGVPGLVDRRGVLLAAPNVTKVRMLPLRDALADRTGLEVIVDNDNTVACLAEWRLGAGRGFDDVVLAGLGTGIGGGVVSGGRLQRGHHGFAGEFGHMIVQPAGLQCPCGQRGCWERYASGSGLGLLAREAAEAHRLDDIVAEVGSVEAIRGEHVTAAARRGDAAARDVVERYAAWVALGLVNLTNLYDPGRIVLSGGLSADDDVYLAPIVASYEATLFASDLRPRPSIVFAELGPSAGAIGAALLADA
jgi:glucokinase